MCVCTFTIVDNITVTKLLLQITVIVYWFISRWIVYILSKIFSRIKFSYLFTHMYLSLAPFIGFDIAFTKVENTLKQRRDKVVSTLFRRRAPTLYQR